MGDLSCLFLSGGSATCSSADRARIYSLAVPPGPAEENTKSQSPGRLPANSRPSLPLRSTTTCRRMASVSKSQRLRSDTGRTAHVVQLSHEASLETEPFRRVAGPQVDHQQAAPRLGTQPSQFRCQRQSLERLLFPFGTRERRPRRSCRRMSDRDRIRGGRRPAQSDRSAGRDTRAGRSLSRAADSRSSCQRGECGIDNPVAITSPLAMSMTHPPSTRRSRHPSTTSVWLHAVTYRG